MYRVGEAFPGVKICRIGTVDDFRLMETKLKPRIEQFTKDRVEWAKELEVEGGLEERTVGIATFKGKAKI